MAGRKEIARELSIYINDRQVINSLGGINREIGRVSSEMRNLNKNSQTYDQDLKKLQGTLGGLKEKQSEFKDEIYATGEVAGNAKEKISQIFLGLATGNLKLVQEGLSGIRGSITAMTQSAMAFIATPIGAAIALLAGVGIASKAIFDFNVGLQESNKLLTALGVSSQNLSAVRSEIQATAETFDKEFSVIAEKANSLAKTYGISISQANAIISEGLANGGAQNNDFLDSLGEYDEFFAKAGFSAKEFTNILNAGFDIGIYADKLPDALKEADLALKEQTKSTRDALVNAFGATFSDDILNKVRTGELTTKQALENIAEKAKESQLSQQQQAQLTADVFKGAGEDAGGALKILQAVGDAAKRELTETAKASLELVSANERLNKAQSDLFEVEGFGNIWTGIQTAAVNALASILEYVSDLKADIQPLIDVVGVVLVNAWCVLKTAVGVVFDFIGGVLKVFSNNLNTFFQFFKKIITLDFKGALDVLKSAFIKLGNIVDETFGRIKNSIINGLKGIISNISPLLEAIGIPVDKILKKLDSFKSKNVDIKVKTTADAAAPSNQVVINQTELDTIAKAKAEARAKETAARQKAAETKKKEEEKAAKEELDRQIALAKAMADLAKAELSYFIANNQTKLVAGEKLTEESLNAEKKRLENVKFVKENELSADRLRQVAAAEQAAKSATELAALKQTIDYNYLTAQQALELEFQSSTDALKKQYELEQAQIKAEQLLIDNELALAEAQSKDEENTVKQEQDYQAEIARYRKLLTDKKITQEEFDRFEDAADKKQKQIKEERELALVAGSLNALGDLAGALGQMFGQSKELAIAGALINGGLAVTQILAEKSELPTIATGIFKAIKIAAAISSTASSISQITRQKAPKTPKFYYGGFTGNSAALGSDEYGAVTGVVHQNEWVAPEVMTRSPRYAATFNWLENERRGIMSNKYFDGGTVMPNQSQQASADNQDNANMLKALLFRLENPIAPKLKIGYADAEGIQNLNAEREVSNNNGILNQ